MTAFENFEVIRSVETDHITSKFSKVVYLLLVGRKWGNRYREQGIAEVLGFMNSF